MIVLEMKSLKIESEIYFDEFWQIYNRSFPKNEKRSLKQQIDVLSCANYFVECHFNSLVMVGFIGYWVFEKFIFLEHLAIKSNFRSQGFGSKLMNNFTNKFTLPIILEIEPEIDATTQRRYNFYKSLGFVRNDFEHYQPPYQIGDNPVRLNILTYNQPISQARYDEFYFLQKTIIMMHHS